MIPWYVVVVRLEHDVGRPLIPLTALIGRHRVPRRLPGLTVHARARHAAGSRRRSDGCAFSSLGIRLQAIQLWPYRAGLAVPRPGRLQTATASLTCSCPRGLSPPGQSGDPRTSLRVPPGCAGDTTKRLTAHTGHEVLPHPAFPWAVDRPHSPTPLELATDPSDPQGSSTGQIPS